MQEYVGQQLGNYHVLRLLGKGGSASVYLGEHIYLKSYAALKILHLHLSEQEAESFLTEARTLSALSHPHIVRVHDFAVQNDVPFLVMEYAPGNTLRHRYPTGTRLPLDTIVFYVQQVASALQYAHDRRLIHRDVKPENMLLDAQENLVLSDFGLALLTPHTDAYSTHATAQQIAGTSLYLAPEQLQGRPRAASDQYALAVVVYEWLCGAPPFKGTPLETAVQHLSVPPAPLRKLLPDLSPTVEEVVLRALSKEPEQRFASVQEFATALQQAVHHPIEGSASSVNARDDSSDSTKTHRPIWKVPIVLTPFIGREQDIADICALLLRPDVHLLTLLGPGGIGKTRLSFQLAARLRTLFAEGVCFVGLAAIRNPEQVMQIIAHELDLAEKGLPPFEQVKQFLREKQMLLILDNFEQIVESAPSLESLLEACPYLKVLVTSRVALRIPSEQHVTVSPLALPDLKQMPGKEAIAHYASVALFVQRARAIIPTFDVTTSNAATLAEICVRLDGLPLAIELAAARIKLLPPQALLPRLAHRFQVLTRGDPTLPTRQQTLRSTIQWSYELLDTWEQRLFRRLSIFVGGCTLEAAEALCATLDGEGSKDDRSVLDVADALIEKSLLRPPNLDEQAEEPRLRMLETIREYGRECLAANGEMEAVCHAHAIYYLALAETAEREFAGTQQAVWFERVEHEYHNLRAAFHWFQEQYMGEFSLRLSEALWEFWSVRGYLTEGRQWLEQAISQSKGVVAPVRANAFARAGLLAYNQNDHRRAVELFEQGLVLFREFGDKRGLALSFYRLGLTAWARGDNAEAAPLIVESLKLSQELGDKAGVADALLILAYISTNQKDYAKARTQTEESITLFREANDKWGIAYTLPHLARVLLYQGNVGAAQERLEETLAFARELGFKGGIVSYLEGQASVCAIQGQLAWAARLWGAAEALRESIGVPLQPVEQKTHEQRLAYLRTHLGETAFQALWKEGRAMPLEEALSAHPSATANAQQAVIAPIMEALSLDETPVVPIAPVSAQQPSSPHSAPPLARKAARYPDELTAREVEVLRLIVQGYSDAQIGGQLVISPRTVNSHVTSIYRKIQVTTRSAATRYAIEHQLF